MQCELALSNFNVAHRLTSSVLYSLPFGRGRKYLNNNVFTDALLGGWQISSIVSLQTGSPLTVNSGADLSNTGIGTDRPNATGATVALPRGQQDPQRFFNIRAFVLEPFGTLGNVGRNTLIGPGIINFDFAASKDFRIREGHQLEFRFEAFNAPNHPNWASQTRPPIVLHSAELHQRAPICERCSSRSNTFFEGGAFETSHRANIKRQSAVTN
jgi:hypothetical protein